MPLRMMIDARMAFHGGIGTYIRHLIPALLTSQAIEHLCVLGAPPAALDGAACRRPYVASIYGILEQLAVPDNRHHATFWHSPHFNVPLGWRGPLVVTVHDLIHLKFPRAARTRFAPLYAAAMLHYIARRAHAIITNSEATKRDLCDWAHLNPHRVTAIPWGVSPIFAATPDPASVARVLARYRVTPPFILWVSAIRPHKNPPMALRAFARVKTRHRLPHQLVMVGHVPAWYQAPLREARTLGIDAHVRWIETVEYEELPVLYHTASALIMPSYYEGFGFPVLEAMAAGLPVLASSVPALSELIDSSCVTIDPDNVDGWSDHLYNYLTHDDLRRTLQERGRERARQFTWERSAAGHLDVYRSIANHPR